MNKRSILVISKLENDNDSALSTWTHIPHPFHVDFASSEEEAIELFQKQDFDMVLLDCTDNSIDHKKLNAVLPILQEDATLLAYQGETKEELEENVEAIFSAKKFQRLQRMLMLEPSVNTAFNIPPFSLN